MRNLKRNQKLIHYAEYEGENPILDGEGYDTGEKEPSYGEVKSLRINTTGGGNIENHPFGRLQEYEKVLITSEPCPLNENSVLWIDQDTTEPHNYIVVRIHKVLNTTQYLARKVSVGG